MNVRRRALLTSVLVLATMALGAAVEAQKPKPATPTTQKPKVPPPATRKPAAPVKPAGMVMRSKYTAADGTTSETTLSSDGIRQRVDLGDGVSVITQCDTQQILQVSHTARVYVALPSGARPVEPSPEPSAKGGVVEYLTTTTDRKEQKEIFGLPAHRVTTVVTKSSSPGACDTKKERVETDGWYAALPVQIACDLVLPRPVPPSTDCRDERRSSAVGDAPAGAPLGYVITAFNEDGTVASTVKMEVTALTYGAVDAATLAEPAGYTRAATPKAFVAAIERAANEQRWGAPKAPGTIRIGVLTPSNTSGEDIPVEAIGNELLEALTVAPYEAVPILAATPAERDEETKQRECDYVMSLDLTALKSSVPGRIGRLTRRASGGGNPSEVHEAKVEYRIAAAGAAAPRAAKSASAKTGAFTWKRAMVVAKLAARLYLGASTGMARMLLAQTGAKGGGLPTGSADPTVNAVSFVATMLQGGADAPVDETSREATVIAAVQSAAADVRQSLTPKAAK